MEGWRMTWVCTELLLLWLGLPLLLWLEALPPTLRIGTLAAAAVYGGGSCGGRACPGTGSASGAGASSSPLCGWACHGWRWRGPPS